MKQRVMHRHTHSSFLAYVVRGLCIGCAVLAVFFLLFSLATSSPTRGLVSCTVVDSSLDPFTQEFVILRYSTNETALIADSCADSTSVNQVTCKKAFFTRRASVCENGCYKGACITSFNAQPLTLSPSDQTACGNYSFVSPSNALGEHELPAYRSLYAIDGDSSSRWYMQRSFRSFPFITFDMRQPSCIDGFSLDSFYRDLPLSIVLQASLDGLSWETIEEERSLTQLQETVSLSAPVRAQYVRLLVLNSSCSYASMSDFKVHASSLPFVLNASFTLEDDYA